MPASQGSDDVFTSSERPIHIAGIRNFILPVLDRSHHVRLSEEFPHRPVVLIFGSYT
jgi:hypothetical protein